MEKRDQHAHASSQLVFEHNAGDPASARHKPNAMDRLNDRRNKLCAIVLIPALVLFGAPLRVGDALVRTDPVVTITDYSPRSGFFSGRPAGNTNTAGVSNSGRMTSLAVAANSTRMYAASSNTGLWRSNNGGVDWCQLTALIACADGPGSAIPVPVIAEIAVAPVPADGSVVLAAAAFDTRSPSLAGIYRSVDAGATFTRVHEFSCQNNIGPALQVRFAPGENNLVFASGGCTVARSIDGGANWTETSPGEQTGVAGDKSMAYIAASEYDPAIHSHWVFACGAGGFFVSSNNGETWRLDNSGAFAAQSCGFANAPHLLAAEPGQPGSVLMARYNLSNAPRFFSSTQADGTQCTNCGEGSLWHGTYQPGVANGTWTQLSSPPTYFGDPSTTDDAFANSPSGVPFVVVQPKPGGYLVFFSDGGTIHVHDGLPPTGYNTFASWHRIDGWDPWAYTNPGGNRRGFFIHSDPFDLAVSSDFSMTLIGPPTNCFLPQFNPLGILFCGNTQAASNAGSLWVANDGGVFRSDAAGTNGIWGPARSGLATLMFNEGTLLTRAGSQGVALYAGLQDNSSMFYNQDLPVVDSTPNWSVAEKCGDCAGYFSDAAVTDRVVHMDLNRTRAFGAYTGPNNTYPTPINGQTAQLTTIPYPFGGGFPTWRNRPVVQTLLNETPPAFDLVKITTFSNDTGPGTISRLYRTSSQNGAFGSWQQVGPNLPQDALLEQKGAVQSSGGHANPTFFVQTSANRLYRSANNGNGVTLSWTPVVDGTGSNGACLSRGFYADPYDPLRLFLDDPGSGGCVGGIKRSGDGGQTWQAATTLQAAITRNGEYTTNCNRQIDGLACPLNSVLYVRGEPQSIFVAGLTGVYASSDAGATWSRLLDGIALPCDPTTLGLNGMSSLRARSVYVFCWGRGVLALNNVSPPSTTAFLSVSAGGTLVSDDARIKVKFPALAVTTDNVMTYTHRLEPFEPLPANTLGFEHFTLDATGPNGTPTTQFQDSYTLTVKFDSTRLSAHHVKPANLSVEFWNGSAWSKVWPCHGCAGSLLQDSVEVHPNHFTEFALVGTPDHYQYLPFTIKN